LRGVGQVIRFEMPLVFPADDVVSEWLATLALAFNDISLANDQLDQDREILHRFFYWLRLAIAHFFETAKFLDETAEVAEVKAFVATLPEETQEHYRTCLEKYRAQETPVQRLRNQALAHYPRLQPNRARRPMRRALEELAGESGQIYRSDEGTIRGSRMLFADDIVGRFFIDATGGMKAIEGVHEDIVDAMMAFGRFVNAALDQWFVDRRDLGAEFVTRDEASVPENEQTGAEPTS
jgi:hypothetical protein